MWNEGYWDKRGKGPKPVLVPGSRNSSGESRSAGARSQGSREVSPHSTEPVVLAEAPPKVLEDKKESAVVVGPLKKVKLWGHHLKFHYVT